jgi:putative ABC transport system permease protein
MNNVCFALRQLLKNRAFTIITISTFALGIGANSAMFSVVKGAALIAIGLIIGLYGAVASGRALSSVLYGVGSLDLGAFALAILSLSVVALLACFLPARQATLVDPIEALRTE